MTPTNMIAGTGAGVAAAATPAATAARAKEREALTKAAYGFEAMFTRQLLGTMRHASGGEGVDDSSAVEQFQEMSDANMANSIASKGGLGIAQLLLQQLDKKS